MKDESSDPRPDPAPAMPALELGEAMLSDETLAQLLGDLATHAEIVSIRARQAPRSATGTQPGPITLRDVSAILVEDGAAVQIAYRHGGASWVDTLMRRSGWTKLVRARQTKDDFTAAPSLPAPRQAKRPSPGQEQ